MRHARLLFALLGAAFLCSGAGLWALGSALSAPAPQEIGPPNGNLATAQSVQFRSQSGSTIHAWFARGVPGRGVVVLAHAVRGNRLGMLGRARFLHEAGYSVLPFDAQAHGESPGEHITFGYLEARDAAAAVAFAATELPRDPIAFLGVSQGGASAQLGSSPLPVSALVLEAVYPTLSEAVADRLAIRLGPLGRPLAPLLLLQLRPRLGVSAEALRPIEGIRHIRAPLLLIVGGHDEHTPLEESRRLFQAAPEPKEIWVLPEASHQDFHQVAGSIYEQRVLHFLASHLGGGAA